MNGEREVGTPSTREGPKNDRPDRPETCPEPSVGKPSKTIQKTIVSDLPGTCPGNFRRRVHPLERPQKMNGEREVGTPSTREAPKNEW